MILLEPGDRAGSWVIEDVVGFGMPRLYRAHHVEVGTSALVKVVPASNATKARQDREVDALKAMHHDRIPEVLDFGLDHDREMVWTAFAWYEAEPLRFRMLGGEPDWRRACQLVRELADMVAHVHDQGYVHRDLRPETVAVDADGRVWLTGFDFAMTQAQLEALKQAPVGDITYLAPEVLADPTHHGSRADVYALGCILFEVLTGRPAFPAAAWGERADQAARMLEWKSKSEPLDPGDGVPPWLHNLVVKSTEPDPERRLPDIDALMGWLDAAQAAWDLPPPAPPPPKVTLRPPRIEAAAPSISRPRRSRSQPVIVSPPPRQPSVPVPVMYLGAATLGSMCALGFSALLILFVELQRGAL